MSANLENSAVATGLGKISFHSDPIESQLERMVKLLHSCSHLTCQQSNAQYSPSQASMVHEMRTSRCSSWFQKRQRNKRSNCQHPLDHRKSKGIPEKHLFCFIDYIKAIDCGSQQTSENSERDGNTRPPDLPLEKFVCRSRSNSQNWTWNNRVIPNQERSMSRLYIVTC